MEIFQFFLAGAKTIQISTTNLFYYFEKHQDYKAKMLAEVLPAVEAAKTDFVKKLEYDTVQDFDYLSWCFNESLRIEPPSNLTIHIRK